MSSASAHLGIPPDRSEAIAGDRRLDRRYVLTLEVQWKLIRRRRVLDSGRGTTVDLSSSGVFFEADRQLPSSGNVELSIAWPVRLHNVAPLQLVVTGRVVRTAGSRTAIRMMQHEFRTGRAAAQERPAMKLAGALHRSPSVLSSNGHKPH
jgi:hypothetical protein